MTEDEGDDFADALHAEHGFPRDHAFGDIGRTFADYLEDLDGIAASRDDAAANQNTQATGQGHPHQDRRYAFFVTT